MAFFFLIILNFALGRNRTRDPRVPEPKRTPLGYILPIVSYHFANCILQF
jgi:hypothetical protein